MTAPKVFISYAHADERCRETLTKHLHPLKLTGELETWHKNTIQAGTERPTEIHNQLDSADLILLLISPDFFSSPTCWDEELPRALARQSTGEARVIPIIVRPCQWQPTPLGKLQALPRDGQPITSWPQEDDAWLDVVQGVRATLRGAESPETKALKTWLERIAGDHETLESYFTDQGAPFLDQIYVEVQLERQGKRQTLDVEHLPSNLSIRQVLDLKPEAHPWVTRRWLLRGVPGAGKTTLVRHLALTLARDGGQPWVPIFASLPQWLREPDWLLDRIEQELDQAGDCGREIRQTLEALGDQGRLLLLLDGLDEVPRERREEAARLLRRLSSRWPKAHLIVTSRPIGTPNPHPSFIELEILPFDAQRRHRFLKSWLDETRAGVLDAILKSDRNLLELAGNPLYLTLIALLYDSGRRPERNRARLYDQVFDLLFDGQHRPQSEPIAARVVVRETLRKIAFDFTRENREALPVGELEARLLCQDLAEPRKLLEEIDRWRGKPRTFLNDVAERTGILGPHDGASADWRFWHRTFREALVGEQLEQDLELDVIQQGGTTGPRAGLVGTPRRLRRWWHERTALSHARRIRGDTSRWAEPYALLAGRLDNPDELVMSLMRVNRALGFRALATTQELSDQTLKTILELSDKWQERAKVFERVPELIDHPIRALALLDQLRRRTGERNDLYFIGNAVASVGERWPEAKSAAEQLQDRLYDHIPTPPEDLFESVVTRDGRIKLWREIPAGNCQMGSLKGKEGSYSDEHPRYEAVIPSSFQMAAVPVTIEQYAAFDPEHRSHFQDQVPEEQIGSHPVGDVSSFEARAFCRWLSSQLPGAQGARLPTEEEWEYAARAGSRMRYWSGDAEGDLASVGWYRKNSDRRTHRVGRKPANAWGLYDVHGNVGEWTLSEWTTNYSGREAGIEIDPSAARPAGVTSRPRVHRGGSCWNSARDTRCACRDRAEPLMAYGDLGFRVLLPVPRG